MGALTVLLTYLLAFEIGVSRRAAVFCTLVAGLGTIVLVYATCFMNNIASAAFLLLSLWSGFRAAATDHPAWSALAGFSIGYAILSTRRRS
ncbi:MAG: hypothetical protein JXR84_04595 [Anaerolineae bacterium]|nr:hypothetical protein [Anaerolineae bacterium]